MTILEAWNIAVKAFRFCVPERYQTFQEFWMDEDGPSCCRATEEEMWAFDTLHDARLQLPAFVANGE